MIYRNINVDQTSTPSLFISKDAMSFKFTARCIVFHVSYESPERQGRHEQHKASSICEKGRNDEAIGEEHRIKRTVNAPTQAGARGTAQ